MSTFSGGFVKNASGCFFGQLSFFVGAIVLMRGQKRT